MNRAALAAAFFLAVSAPAAASPSAQEVANDVSDEVMSPYCPGVTLAECASEAALELRGRIETWAQRGWSKERIVAHLEDEWGTQIKAVPPADGWGLLAWVLPGGALVAGLAVAAVLIRRWRRAPPASGSARDVAPKEHARLEAELARLRLER